MNLFINTISSNSKFIIFDDKRNIKSEKEVNIRWNESSRFIKELDIFLKEEKLDYFDIENIVLVNGPWSFTWVRTAVLAVNSINFITKKSLTPISYFDLFEDFPIIKASSRRDCFFKKDKNSEIEIIANEEIEKNYKKAFWEANLWIEIFENINYCDIIKNIELKNFDKIEPLYIKKPNIC